MALPTSIELQIVTPDRLILRERVDEVEIPGSEGYFGVLPGHTPLLASLAVGERWYRKGEEKSKTSNSTMATISAPKSNSPGNCPWSTTSGRTQRSSSRWRG